MAAKHTTAKAEDWKNDSSQTDPSVTGDSTAASAENSAPSNGGAVPQGWVEEPTGFPPYWTPDDKGAWFRGIPLMKDEGYREGDDENPSDFARYVVRATHEIDCYKGKSDAAEGVIVKPGEFFTVSAYASMRLERYYGHEVLIKAVEKVRLDQKRTMWKFQVFVAADTRQLLDKERSERAKELLAARKGAIVPF